jgi:DNA-directed RNA polymerase sigma subunit (sigma70/sigma32)
MTHINSEISAFLLRAGFDVTIPREKARHYHRLRSTVVDAMTRMAGSDAIRETAALHSVPEADVVTALALGGNVRLEDVSIWLSAVEPDPEAVAVAADDRDRLLGVVAGLPGQETAVIVARLGLDGSPARRLVDVAGALGMPRERVAVLEGLAFSRLRHPSRSARLAE